MTRISKTLTAAALACGLALSTSTAPSAAGMNALASLKSAAPQSPIVDVRGRRGYHRGRNVGLAILGAAAAAAIVSGAARAERYRYRHDDRCDFYDYKCSQGYGWACRKFDYRCLGDY